MVNPIPESVKKNWDIWNIRSVILFSLSLQTILILFAPLRKGTGNKLIMSLIWSAYLLADWTANFGVGLIAEKARDTHTPDASLKQPADNNELLAFWAPFLLLHLGGPDTITAFALEDNELWLRHLFGLVFQAVAAVYIFLLSLPGNKLLFPTVLVFIAGMIKYFERIRALYFASTEKFRDSTLRKQVEHFERLRALYLENGYAVQIKKDRDYLEVGCQYFKLLRSILVDLVPSFKRVNFEEPSIDDFSPTEALGIIEVELNLVYEVLHTKIQVTQCVLGIVLRFICFGSVMAALSVFYFQVEKHGFNEFDVCVTYTLFLGAIALDITAFFMLVFSDWTFVALQNDDDKTRIGNFKNRIASVLRWFLILKSPRWHSHGGGRYEVLATPFLFRRWSGSVSGYSWIRYWLKARPGRVRGLHLACQKVVHYLGFDRLIPCMAIAKNKVIQFLHISKIIDEIRIKTSLSHQPLTKEFWHFMFYEIKRKAQYAEDPEAGVKGIICSASGYCTLQELDTNGRLTAVLKAIAERYVYFSINVSVAVWHVSTELLYYTAEEVPNKKTNHAREFSKILSDYMLYLLQMKPTMLNSAPCHTKFTLRDTRDAANEFFEKNSFKPSPVKLACEKIMLEPDFLFSDSHVRKEFSALEDARELANKLQMLEEDKKWEIVSKVWMEILSYGASHCRPMAHAQQVTNGGELITFVWLLMLHFDLVEPQV